MLKELLKHTFIYRIYADRRKKKEALMLAELSRLLKRDGDFILKTFFDTIQQEGLLCWLELGTLLGFAREHDFIPHDNDIDTGAFLEDAGKIRAAMLKHGFELIREYNVDDGSGKEESYLLKGYKTSVDIFYFTRGDNVMNCCYFVPLVNLNKKKNHNRKIQFRVRQLSFPLTEFEKVAYKGTQVYVPVDLHDHLKSKYGESYMIPDPEFAGKDYRNSCFYTYEEKPASGYIYRWIFDMFKV